MVQYEVEMVLPHDFYSGLNGSQPVDAIKHLTIGINNYFSGSNINVLLCFYLKHLTLIN